jgi:signal transduction histidine kinase
MTGFSDAELVGRLPPFPHWPHDRLEENARLLQQELQGRSPAGGIEVKIMRKDGSIFDARMYVLAPDRRQGRADRLDDLGHQHHRSQARARPALRLARTFHDRARRPRRSGLRALGASRASSCSRTARTGSGSARTPDVHAVLAGGIDANATQAHADDPVDGYGGLPAQELTEAGTSPREVYVDSLDKWFDVRARYLQWTDGRLAQMLIATDITARLRAEQLAQQQADRAHFTSRLIAVGEMASSVAHELNQPLTAITNYCNGMVSRVRNESIGNDDLSRRCRRRRARPSARARSSTASARS